MSEQKQEKFSAVLGDERGAPSVPGAPGRVDAATSDLTADLRAALRDLAPSAFTAEGQLDVEMLRGLLGEDTQAGAERYRFSWTGQADAVRLASAPTAATLKPQPERGTGWDDARNVFVEGDNLQVLKLMGKAYFGKVKLAYLDPPYNTGTDRIYRDSFADSIEDYLKRTEQTNGDGDLTVANPEASGRFHSAWLSMMYPRLHVARRLLRPDGVLIAAIDDNEVHHLRLLLDSVFGPENFVACMAWEGGRKNDAKFISVGHDYMLIYARDLAQLKEKDLRWRVTKPGVQDILDKVEELREKHGKDYAAATTELRAFLTPLKRDVARLAAASELVAQTYPEVASFFPELARPLTELPGQRYNQVDERGAYRLSDISWPGGGGHDYELLHPNGKPVRKPTRGWLYPEDEMQRLVAENRVDFKADETGVPEYKRYLHETEREVLTSVFYRTRTNAAQELTALMGEEVFDNPKDADIIGRLIEATTSGEDLVLDFFGGSASTADAVMRTNVKDGGNRQWVVVQLPEEAPEDRGKPRSSFGTISAAAIERIKKSAAAMDLPDGMDSFRVFALDRAALASWAVPDDVQDADGYIEAQTDMSSVALGELEASAAVWQVAIREGYPLTSATSSSTDGGYTVWRISAEQTGLPEATKQPLFVCLEDAITEDLTQRFPDVQGNTFVVRESALDDSTTANMAMHCRLKTL